MLNVLDKKTQELLGEQYGIYDTLLLTIVTMPCISSSELGSI